MFKTDMMVMVAACTGMVGAKKVAGAAGADTGAARAQVVAAVAVRVAVVFRT